MILHCGTSFPHCSKSGEGELLGRRVNPKTGCVRDDLSERSLDRGNVVPQHCERLNGEQPGICRSLAKSLRHSLPSEHLAKGKLRDLIRGILSAIDHGGELTEAKLAELRPPTGSLVIPLFSYSL